MRVPGWVVDAGRLAGTLTGLATAELVLARAGRALPPLTTNADVMSRTLAESEPLLVAISALRLVALAIGAGLLAITALGIAGRAAGAARLVSQLDRWTPPSLRRILDGALGVGLAASIGMSSLPAGADPTPAPATTLRRLPDAAPPPLDANAQTTILRRLPDAAAGLAPPAGPAAAPTPPLPNPTVPTTTTVPATPTSRGDGPQPTVGPRAGIGREVVVGPGDSFWRLAERHQAQRLGRSPTDTEVAACWTQLVALNRHRLVVPGNPDLLFPGQIVHLPCP